MDNYEYTELLKNITIKIGNITGVVEPNKIKLRLKEIEELDRKVNRNIDRSLEVIRWTIDRLSDDWKLKNLTDMKTYLYKTYQELYCLYHSLVLLYS